MACLYPNEMPLAQSVVIPETETSGNSVTNSPLRKEIQSDGRIKVRGKVEEVDKYLRVILLDDGETVHNALFNRSFKGDN